MHYNIAFTIVLVLCTCSSLHSWTPPELPKTFDTTIPEFTTCTVLLNATADLQQAINEAKPGDTICLEAGSERSGNFILPEKENLSNLWITIRTSTPDAEIPRGLRIDPSKKELLAKVYATNADPVFKTALRANHYLFVGLEVTSTDFNYGLFRFGNDEQTMRADVPAWLFIERCWIHGPSETDCRRGVALNSQYSAVQDSYIENFRSQDDTQAIGGWNGLGPFLIKNNYLSATGENVIFGGAGTTVPEEVSSDIVIQGNHFYKDPSWTSPPYGVKNILEIKTGRRVLIDSNILENMLADLNNGLGILLSLVDVLPMVTEKTILSDFTITNNIVKNTLSGFGMSSAIKPWVIERVLFENNLFYDIHGDGREFILLFCQDLKINHNTFIPVFNSSLSTAVSMGYVPLVEASFTNNIASLGRYGVTGDGYGGGTPAIEYYSGPAETVNDRWQANVLFTDEVIGSGSYPPRFYFPKLEDIGFIDYLSNFKLSDDSPFKNNGTDGTDVGVNMDLLMSKVKGVLEGSYGSDVPEAPYSAPLGSMSPASPSNRSPSASATVTEKIYFAVLTTVIILLA